MIFVKLRAATFAQREWTLFLQIDLFAQNAKTDYESVVQNYAMNGMTKGLTRTRLTGDANLIVQDRCQAGTAREGTSLTMIIAQINVMTGSWQVMKIAMIKYQMLMDGDASLAVKVEILMGGIVSNRLLGSEQISNQFAQKSLGMVLLLETRLVMMDLTMVTDAPGQKA